MITFGIIGAMPEEIKELRDIMKITETKEIAGIKYYLGEIHGENVVVACSGIGKVNAAACTQVMIDTFKIDKIINTGVAGAISEKLDIGDIVISNDVTYHDVSPMLMKKTFPFQQFINADANLVRLVENACKENKEILKNYLIGRIVSGDSFIEDNVIKKRLEEKLHADCVEMEGAAIGHVAHMNNVPFVIIRSISDKANEDAKINFEKFIANAAKLSCRLIISMLEQYQVSEKLK